MTQIPVRRALISVYDKTGLDDLGRGLAEAGVEIVSTGSTASRLRDAGVAVTAVDELTGFPECLDGRVKTLHPKVHAGVLADRRLPDHVRQLEELGIAPFDLVVCNLYPFSATVASGATPDECVEQIDIGGPTMVRAAAKNHPSVAVVVDPARYDGLLAAVQGGGTTLEQRKQLAAEAFAHTASYDLAVATWCAQELVDDPAWWPEFAGQALQRREVLRYGENPHQRAALYLDPDEPPGLAQAEQLHGKPMSYNNYVDTDAARRAAYDHAEPCVAIIKHANPCGIALGADVAEAHRKAHACDPVSAFGGVIAANRPVSLAMAEQIAEIFTEVVVAPAYDDGAAELLARKPSIRLLVCPPLAPGPRMELRQVSGGLLVQSADVFAPEDDPATWTLQTGEPADADLLRELGFAWRSVRAVKSNAILLAAGGATVGVGMGQVNRVDAARLAVARAGERAAGSVAASDAFFPFPDGLQVLLDAGVRAVVQPGGSVRDDEVTAAATAAGVTLYVTGTRHFSRTDVPGEDLSSADFSRESLQGRRFEGARLVGADFSESELRGVVFEDCDLSGAELTSAELVDCALLRCRLERVRLFGSVLRGCKLTGSTFARAQLRPLTVDGGDWSYVSLRRADLRGVALRGLRLAEADLTDADLSGCDLTGSDLSHARLRGVRLSGADLRGAVLDGCDVDGVDWTGVRIDLAQAVLLARARGAVVEDG